MMRVLLQTGEPHCFLKNFKRVMAPIQKNFIYLNNGSEWENVDGALLNVVTRCPWLMEALPYSTHGF